MLGGAACCARSPLAAEHTGPFGRCSSPKPGSGAAGQQDGHVVLPPLPQALQLQQLPQGAPRPPAPCASVAHRQLQQRPLHTPRPAQKKKLRVRGRRIGPAANATVKLRPPSSISCPAAAPPARAQKAGLEATGQLANVSKTAGFGSVSALLQKNPKARSRPAPLSCDSSCDSCRSSSLTIP